MTRNHPSSIKKTFIGIPASIVSLITSGGLIAQGDAVLAAVSGGSDSVALVTMLARLSPHMGFSLAVAHLNHKLRDVESDEDQAFVEDLSRSLGLVCHSRCIDVKTYGKENGLSLEEAARNVRYAFLFETADRHGFNKIATAHHTDDNAELFLMNLFRGSGLTGLKTMGPTGHRGRVIRPLIETDKETLLSYIRDNALAFRTDSSNADVSFLRNRIRNDLLPLLETQYQKGIGRILTRTARILGEDEIFLKETVDALFNKALVCVKENSVTLSTAALSGCHVAARRRIVREAMFRVKSNLRRISFDHVESVLNLLATADPRKTVRSLDLPDRLRVIRHDGHLVFRLEDGPLRETPVMERKSHTA